MLLHFSSKEKLFVHYHYEITIIYFIIFLHYKIYLKYYL